MYGETRTKYKFYAGEPQAKRQFGRPRYRWELSIEIHLKEA
jgi:hypothetical protein